jgi:hypothetical protein
VLAELLDTSNPGFTEDPPAPDARPHRRPRRASRGLAVGGRSCRRPPTTVGAAAWPAPVSVVVPASRLLEARSRGLSPGADRRGTRRLRQAVAVGGLAVLVVCSGIGFRTALGRIGGGPLATTGAPGGAQTAAVRLWTVRPGDTLWSIAQAVDPNGDVRPLVDRLAAEARGTAIYPGERIAIPGR